MEVRDKTRVTKKGCVVWDGTTMSFTCLISGFVACRLAEKRSGRNATRVKRGRLKLNFLSCKKAGKKRKGDRCIDVKKGGRPEGSKKCKVARVPLPTDQVREEGAHAISLLLPFLKSEKFFVRAFLLFLLLEKKGSGGERADKRA